MSKPDAAPLLERALADLIEHPDSSAREIAARLGVDRWRVWGVLDNAAYYGKCQRWLPGGGTAWLWQVPGHEGPRYRRAAQREETVTEDCPRCRHWTPAQRKWHHCIGCDGTGQVPAQQEESTR